MEKYAISISCFYVALYRIFVRIRFHINSQYTAGILEIISRHLDMLSETGSVDYVQFRQEVLDLVKDSDEHSIYTNSILATEYLPLNQYLALVADDLDNAGGNLPISPETVTDNLTEIKRYLPLLCEAVAEMRRLLLEDNDKRASDLVDAFHDFPNCILHKRVWDAGIFWCRFIADYRNTWEPTFLLEYELNLYERKQQPPKLGNFSGTLKKLLSHFLTRSKESDLY